MSSNRSESDDQEAVQVLEQMGRFIGSCEAMTFKELYMEVKTRATVYIERHARAIG